MTSIIIRSDNHVHTSFSSDSDTPMENQILRAKELGLSSLCFTDHIDYDFPKEKYGMDFEFSMENYFAETGRLRNKYPEINIRTGVELGLKSNVLDKACSLTDAYPFDFVIGSTHLVDDMDPYYPEYWESNGEEEGILHYYEVTLENINQSFDFDVYGHIDYIIRYCPTLRTARENHTINESFPIFIFQKYKDLIAEILSSLIEKGKGIEINTGGFKYDLGHPNPHEEIIKLYRSLGGKIITIGSDAHEPEHLAYDFAKIPAILKECDFSYYTEFAKRTADFISF